MVKAFSLFYVHIALTFFTTLFDTGKGTANVILLI